MPAHIAGSLPIDVAVSADAKFVYELYDGLGAIVAYATAPNGTLTAVNSITSGIPAASAQGMAIYERIQLNPALQGTLPHSAARRQVEQPCFHANSPGIPEP